MIEVLRQARVKSAYSCGIVVLSLLLLNCFLHVSTSRAQSTSGRVRGTVTDSSGSAIAGASVSLISTSTNVSRQATTSPTGEYIFLEVPIGSYEIDVNQAGFKKFVRKDIVVDLK